MGFLGERSIFCVGVFADRGMLPGLARTIALTTIVVRIKWPILIMRASHFLSTREYK